MELNPQHPVTATLHDHWHKIVAAILCKYRSILPPEIILTSADIEALDKLFPAEQACVVAHDQKDGLKIRLVPMSEGERLARETARKGGKWM